MKQTIDIELKFTEEQVSIICCAFHKWFRVVDCKGDAEMWKAINNLEKGIYHKAMVDALKEAGIEVEYT